MHLWGTADWMGIAKACLGGEGPLLNTMFCRWSF